MSLESFYGGRIGASFIIVERFDGIDIPQDGTTKTYKAKYLAISTIENIDNKEEYIYALDSNGNFIEKNEKNYEEYEWKVTTFDGTDVYVDTEPRTLKSLVGDDGKPILADGMYQCFKEGGASTDRVNYGEYVIIDTPDKNHPDNGKVFRRGMDYQKNPYGAEYIGQVVGPQGPAPEITPDHYDNITAEPISDKYKRQFKMTYDEASGDLIPGTNDDYSEFNDTIKWVTAILKDEYNNISRCVFGFKIPYLVLDFEANSIDPYNKDYRYKDTEGNWQYHNLISKDTTYYQNGKWIHPFFEKWQVKVPPGIHGDNSTNIEVVHTKTKPLSMNNGLKVKYYREETLVETSEAGELNESVDILLDNIIGRDPDTGELIWKDTLYTIDENYKPIYDINTISCKIKLQDENIYYVNKKDCYMDMLRYRETIFDNIREGECRYYYIGEKNDIQRITLSKNGILTVFYKATATPQDLEYAIKWIEQNGISIDEHGTVKIIYNTLHEEPEGSGTYINDYQDFYQVLKCFKDTHSIQFGDDGTVTVIYNTVHEEDDPDNPGQKIQVNDTDKYPQLVDWITDVSLSQQGEFKVLFNNNTRGDNGQYTTTLEWIDWILVNEDGTIDFYLNTDHETPAYTSFLRLKIIDDIEIQTVDTTLPVAEQLEGTGDQKIHITYNVEDEMNPGQKEKQIVGNPLNYIIETAVSIPNDSYPDVPYSHFLVYYSDPVLRQSMRDKWVTYPSKKYTGVVWTQWVDLGDIRGSQNGIHIITNVKNMDDIKNIPPEQLKADAAGWNVTYTPVGSTTTELLAFDYNTREWYSIGSIDSSLINPATVVAVSQDNGSHMPDPADVSDLLNNGLWFATETHRYAY